MFRIFIIEDDPKIRMELSLFLNRYHYECSTTEDYENAIAKVLAAAPDLLLLDINLPYYDGFHICREIRKKSSLPIIIVTSRDSELDELMSMNLGADDFITKPFNTHILLAHIASVLKRTTSSYSSDEISHNGVILNISRCSIHYNDREAELSKNELRILKLLISNKECVISRDDIMNELWQSNEFVDDNTLTVNINRLRKKLDGLGATDYIKTKRGLGYVV